MKLIVLPLRTISSKQILLHATAIKPSNPDFKPTIQDRIVKKAADTWTGWEAATSGWKKKVVDLGNKAISTVDYREHSLKSIASESAFKRALPENEDPSKSTLSVSHPDVMSTDFVREEIRILADEGVPRHKQKFTYSCIVIPFTAPFMLVPVVPNLPFFYVAYRAWCHYRAMQGASHLQRLLKEERLSFSGSKTLSEIYKKDGNYDATDLKRILQDRNPEMIAEYERAVTQLNKAEAHANQQEQAAVTEKEAEINKTRARTGMHK